MIVGLVRALFFGRPEEQAVDAEYKPYREELDMAGLSEEALRRMDPDYFHTMAPYALALGVHKRFARAFGTRKLSSCPYLTTGMDGHRTASAPSRVGHFSARGDAFRGKGSR